MTAAKAKTRPRASNGQQWPAAKVQMIPITELRRYAGNAKAHPPEQISTIANLIKEFGVTTAILIDENNEIICGHGRLDAAESLGMPKFPVMRAIGWSEAQKKAYRLADNTVQTHAGAAMLPELVKIELADLEKLDYDVERFGLTELDLPDLEIADGAPKRERKKVTIFVSVKKTDLDKANKLIATALNKARIEHNL